MLLNSTPGKRPGSLWGENAGSGGKRPSQTKGVCRMLIVKLHLKSFHNLISFGADLLISVWRAEIKGGWGGEGGSALTIRKAGLPQQLALTLIGSLKSVSTSQSQRSFSLWSLSLNYRDS